jgi:hypothetical protein
MKMTKRAMITKIRVISRGVNKVMMRKWRRMIDIWSASSADKTMIVRVIYKEKRDFIFLFSVIGK